MSLLDKIAVGGTEYNILIGNNAGARNSIYRGKNLGTSVTAEQYAAIAAGTFEDLYIGDYWVIDGITYRIAAFDYWYNTGDTACTTHHLVIVPDSAMYNAQMNTTNTTAGAYIGSNMYTTNLANAKATIIAAFGLLHILSHREYFANAVTNGKQSAGAWYDSDVDLMNEEMVYGCPIFTPANDGTTVLVNNTTSKSQLALFANRPDLITTRGNWWMRDVVSSAYFAIVRGNGNADYNNASSSIGVRPVFAIC